MKIGEILSKAIKEGKWVDISYTNKNNELTYYWIAIKDISVGRKSLQVDIFNDKKSYDTIDNIWISFDSVKTARIIDFSSYNVPDKLIDKIEKNIASLGWLEYDKFNHNILNYYKECVYYDTDPFQSQYEAVPGIDFNYFLKKEKCTPYQRTGKEDYRRYISLRFIIEQEKIFSSCFKCVIY